MKAKALLLAASAAVMATSTSVAQVYSVNAVGYVQHTVPANGYAILANPLNGTNNNLNTVLPLPADGSYDGTAIYRFDCATQQYRDTLQYLTGLGWFSPSDPSPTVNPGEGFFLQNVVSAPLNLTWLGEVSVGTLNNPLPAANLYCIKSSILPISGTLEDIGFPAEDGDAIYFFDPICQCYRDTYQYLTGLGWYSPSDPGTEGPFIPAATGFFIQKAPGSTIRTGNKASQSGNSNTYFASADCLSVWYDTWPNHRRHRHHPWRPERY